MDTQPLGGRWGTVAASVMRRPGLSVAAKAVYAALATYADRIGWIWVRQETIASDLERSRAWVHAAIAELESHGLVLHDRQYIEGRQRASRYRLLDGLVRQVGQTEARVADEQVSDETDAAVQPADTSHHDDKINSPPSARGRAQPAADENKADRPADADTASSALVPADWVPTAADVVWARTRHPDLDVLAFTEAFVLSCRAKGYRYADISAAWRRWLVEPKGRLPLVTAKPNRDFRHDRSSSSQRRTVPSSTPGSAEVQAVNADRAADVLERIMARRAGHPAS